MNLSQRLRALENVAREQGALTLEPPCPECRGPRPDAYGGVIIDLTAGEALKHCSLCGRALDPTGRALGEHGFVIYLHSDRADVPMPE